MSCALSLLLSRLVLSSVLLLQSSEAPEFTVRMDSSAQLVALIRRDHDRQAGIVVFEYLGEDVGLRHVHACGLVGGVPEHAILSTDGRFYVTLFEPHKAEEPAVTVYDLARKEHSTFALRDFLDQRTLKALAQGKIPHWRGACTFNLSSTKAYLTTRTDANDHGVPFVVVDLLARTIGTTEERDVNDLEHLPAQTQVSWRPSARIVETAAGLLPERLTLRRFVGLPNVDFLLQSGSMRYLAVRRSAASHSPGEDQPTQATNSIGMPFVRISAGEFHMGSPNDEEGRDDDEMLHEVSITRPFYLGVYEVTQRQYWIVTRLRPSRFNRRRLGGPGWEHPVDSVTWDAAEEFCRKLSALEGERSAGRSYRLPTEAEWEFACRAGSQHPFFFGPRKDELGDYAWYKENSDAITHRVGTRKPNAWGLYDMYGNVHEWCSDWYSEYPIGEVKDPKGPNTPANSTGGEPWIDEAPLRVARGFGWDSSWLGCRSAARGAGSPDTSWFGFRVVLVYEPMGDAGTAPGKR